LGPGRNGHSVARFFSQAAVDTTPIETLLFGEKQATQSITHRLQVASSPRPVIMPRIICIYLENSKRELRLCFIVIIVNFII
jgi:hypothetical protein